MSQERQHTNIIKTSWQTYEVGEGKDGTNPGDIIIIIICFSRSPINSEARAATEREQVEEAAADFRREEMQLEKSHMDDHMVIV